MQSDDRAIIANKALKSVIERNPSTPSDEAIMSPARSQNVPASPGIHRFRVVENAMLCREHFRLTLETCNFPIASPGQFIHLGPVNHQPSCDRNEAIDSAVVSSTQQANAPFLRRAFSIAGLQRANGHVRLDVIYRVVGKGTQWMASLRQNDRAEAIGPLGNRFVPPTDKRRAWLVAGGVGLPPLIWWAQMLCAGGVEVTFFLGARSNDLIALSFAESAAGPVCDELPCCAVMLATDDGSLGVHGTVIDAMQRQADRTDSDVQAVEVYTCGPEAMMRAVADWCARRDVCCHVCTERDMGCGIGTCQSCVVAVHDNQDAEGWRYALCCFDGPVFDARQIVWDR